MNDYKRVNEWIINLNEQMDGWVTEWVQMSKYKEWMSKWMNG